MEKSLVKLLKEADELDSLNSPVKTSFMNDKGKDRPVPIIKVYAKYFDPQIDGFGEFEREAMFPADVEMVTTNKGTGMGLVLKEPMEDEVDSSYVEAVLDKLTSVVKRYGAVQLKAIGNGKNYISNSEVDTLKDYTPEEALELGMSLDDKSKNAIYRFEITGLDDNELSYVKDKLKESGVLSENVSEKARLMALAGIVSESQDTLEKVDVTEDNWEDADLALDNKDKKTSIKEFRNVVRKIIKEELTRKFSNNK